MDNAGNTGTAAGGKANVTPSGTPDANRSPTIGMGDFTLAAARRATGVPEDIRHPKIKAMMDPYLAKNNNYINLSGILTASNKRITDLPTLPSYTTLTGSLGICWNTILGRCFKGKRCRYNKGHVQKADMTDEFADAVTNCIRKGALYYPDLTQGGSPDKKRNAPDGPADDA